MATQTISPLQATFAKEWAGLTPENHLYNIFQNEPQKASEIVQRIYPANRYKGVQAFINKYPAKELPHDGEYFWMLKGDDRKAVNILSYTSTDTNRPGINKSVFRLELAQNFFQASDVLIFDDRAFSVRIMTNGVPTGNGWSYEVMHKRPEETHFIPPSLLSAGKKVSKLYASVARTLNKEYGGVQFTSPFKMRNIMSTVSKEKTVAGNMHERPLLIKMTDPAGNSAVTWTRYEDLMVDWQWEHEKANNLMYSEFNENSDGTITMKGSSGYPIFEGAGLRQQISPANKFYYSTFTLDYLFEVLFALSENILPEDTREFVIMTGERGMLQFHKAVEDRAALLMPLGVADRITGSGADLGVQGQYRRYNFPQGINVTVMSEPSYNDPIDNRTPHPDGGFTEAYRYTCLNVGTAEGEPNIQRVHPRGRTNLKWYIPGSTSPFGPNTGNQMGASGVDGYEVKYLTNQGIMLKNPLSCCELIYNGTV